MSWYQTRPSLSLKLIQETRIGKGEGIIDVGGGASALVDCLPNDGYRKLAVVDISVAAIQYEKARLGQRASSVEWYEADVTKFRSPRRLAIWHDRAVFHFLTNPVDRMGYVRVLTETLNPDGHLVIATFALDGPPKCSGLDVMRYDAELLSSEIGERFALLDTQDETHTTPWGTEQKFKYCRFQKRSSTCSS